MGAYRYCISKLLTSEYEKNTMYIQIRYIEWNLCERFSMNLLQAKTEMQNTPRAVPLRWYLLEAVCIVLGAAALVAFT